MRCSRYCRQDRRSYQSDARGVSGRCHLLHRAFVYVSFVEFCAISYAFCAGFSVVNIFAIIMLPVSVYASIL